MKQAQLPLALNLVFPPLNAKAPRQVLHSGYAALDRQLPDGGWPLGGITEIFYPADYPEALQLILPALAELSHTERWLAWVSPPQAAAAINLKIHGINRSRILQIHPHPTTDGLWAVEKALRSPTCGAVLSWVAGADHDALARLQNAAEAGNTCGFIFRPDWAYKSTSPAALQIRLAQGARSNELLVHPL